MRRPVIRKKLRLHFENRGALVFVPEKNETYQLNEPATKILQLCNGKNTIHQIISMLADQFYKCEINAIKSDVNEAIKKLIKNKIIYIKED
jgi:coenzyme PQQ biosynthesis protein PqqD